jgi:glycosyltransferase involved in cell wall biosynthesis
LGFEKELKSMREFSEVDFVGLVPFEDLDLYLSAADIGLVLFLPAPNHIKAMPNKIFEYMIAGLPVIASHFPLWKEIVEGNNCGLTVDPENPQEIAEAVEYLLKRPQLMQEMGENGSRAVLREYNWGHEAEKLLGVYKELLGSA